MLNGTYMNNFVPKDENYVEKVRNSFAQQEAMRTIGASIKSIEPGHVEVEFGYDVKLTQQHGFIHAGMSTAVLDTTCGYAAFSLMPENSSVLTIEFKVNFLSPAQGDKFLAVGKVKKAGRTILVCDGELYAMKGGERKLVATMLGTMMCLAENRSIEKPKRH